MHFAYNDHSGSSAPRQLNTGAGRPFGSRESNNAPFIGENRCVAMVTVPVSERGDD